MEWRIGVEGDEWFWNWSCTGGIIHDDLGFPVSNCDSVVEDDRKSS